MRIKVTFDKTHAKYWSAYEQAYEHLGMNLNKDGLCIYICHSQSTPVTVEHILQELNVQVMSACVPWMKGIPPTSLMVLVSIQSYAATLMGSYVLFL